MDSLNIMMFFRYPPFDNRAGGGEVVEWNTMLELAKRGHRIHIVIGKSQALPKIPNVRFHIIPSYGRRSIIDTVSAISYMVKSIDIKNIDIIHGFHPEMVLTNLFHKISKKPVVHEIHFPQLYPYSIEDIMNYKNRPKALRWGLHMRCDKFSAMCSNRIITPSNFMKNLIEKTYSLKNKKISVVSNGVNEEILRIKKHNKKNEKIRLLFIGRLTHHKGIDIILKSLKKAIEYNEKIELNIIGEGRQKKEYTQLAENLEISKYINFLGFLDESEKIKYLTESDILLAPSRVENQPLVVMEGMAAGLPVIGSAVGGIPELIKHDSTGIIIPPDNVDALANAIIDLISNDGKIQSIGISAKKYAENNFTWKKRIDRIEQIYAEIL